MPVKIGEMLQKEGLITPQQLQEALTHQKQNGVKLGRALVSLGFVKDDEITGLLSRQYGVPSINLATFDIDPTVLKVLPGETCRKYQVIPISRAGAVLSLAMSDPTNVFAMDDIKFMTGYNVDPVVASEIAIEEAINRFYGSARSLTLRQEGGPPTATSQRPGGGGGLGKTPSLKEVMDGPGLTFDDMASVGLSEVDIDSIGEEEGEVETLKTEEDEIDLGALSRSSEAAPVVKLANVLLIDSLKRGASDIHIEPYEKEFRVRFRIDGILYNIMALPMKLKDPLTSRIKIMSKLDISEKRLPQDGRIKIRLKIEDRSREMDFRVSCLPTLWGEKIVMRLLDKSKLMLDMTKLGFEPESLAKFKRNIDKPYGIVLVTGPTGSGKTNTLYSALASLNKPDINIMTAEDPVEFNFDGINQVAVRSDIGLSFAAALRSFLRQDPDVVMIGEIRDAETAEIAVRASLTGHLVFSTLHTNDAPSSVNRLIDMGIPNYLVASAAKLIMAQRMVRKICKRCKEEAKVLPEVLIKLGVAEDELATFKAYEGRGCSECNNTGMSGRTGLFEVMEITPGVERLILESASAPDLQAAAIQEGMQTLRMAGIEKVRNGICNIEQILAETS